ncbi:MAG TPA: lysine--tRNA ligase [Phycisphaerae bacterium]|nr:lysine--tRNA ligase [Phycisphaerae bacterium]
MFEDNPQFKDRLTRLEKWKAAGVDPFGGRIDGLITTEEARKLHTPETPHDGGPTVKIAGRIVLLRDIGKLIFITIADWTGRIQIGLAKQFVEKQWDLAKLLELGDMAWFSGKLGHTKTGEITVWADQLGIACKALLPPPEKFHGLSDTELRYRQRYLDLFANPDSLEIFLARSRIMQLIRDFLRQRCFVEVETPMMQPIPGGAAARPFITHHNALDIDLYMRISPELYLKRLLVGGMERVFEINRNFRNEGIDTKHNPEFTMLELYQAYSDLAGMMELTETLIATLARDRHKAIKPDAAPDAPLHLPFGQRIIDFTPPFERFNYGELFQRHAGVKMFDAAAVKACAAQHHIEQIDQKDNDVLVGELFERCVEPALAKLDRPVFVYDYPAGLCPLTRRKPGDEKIAERFELYIAGMELANAYTELNDPLLQHKTFSAQLAGLKPEESMARMDNDFIDALSYGMPPAGGLGIGIDRLVMLLTNRTSIRDVVLFPLLRPHGSHDATGEKENT